MSFLFSALGVESVTKDAGIYIIKNKKDLRLIYVLKKKNYYSGLV